MKACCIVPPNQFVEQNLVIVLLGWDEAMTERALKDRYALLQRGLFPETLPPCFTSTDLKRSLSGLVRKLQDRAFHAKRQTDYIRYNGTKHDGSRRYYGTPNPISYFYVASFLADHWSEFSERFDASPFSVSRPKVAKDGDDRAVIMQSLSELTTIASKKLSYASFILKTDVAQFFPSLYTHAISWSAHGIDASKADTNANSTANYFNSLDLFVRNCQLNDSRGVLIGPDGFRLVAEYVMAGLDVELQASLSPTIIGAARHVDDYYIGLVGEPEALASLSVLRDRLQRYSLQINDSKTKIMSGIDPLNDLWAQDLRQDSKQLGPWFMSDQLDKIILFLNKAFSISKDVSSSSPVKIAFRSLDEIKIYDQPEWSMVEPYLQRAIFHHPHALDYTALLVIKRVARGGEIDKEGWKNAAYNLIKRHLSLNHHHEIVWLLWLLIVADLGVSDQLVTDCCENENAHIRALIVAAYQKGLLKHKPPIRLGSKLASTDDRWLLNLVARSLGYSRAPFGGALADEFEHLANKKVRLIDFKAHLKLVEKDGVNAISRTRYGYDGEKKKRGLGFLDFDGEDEDDGDDEIDDDSEDLDIQFLERMSRDNT
jgi:hypothetical protein